MEPLEVNVIFTGPRETAAALTIAKSLADGLGACIRVRAAIAVPIRLGLDQCPVSIPFMQKRLSDLISDPALSETEHTLHLYVCRDANEALLRALKPNSLVVIGGRKHWWPTSVAQLERALRAKGHRVVFVDAKRQTAGSLR
jgi:hypothetical protein